MLIDMLAPHLPVFIGVLARIGGLFLTAPVLSSRSVPRVVKVMLVVGLTIAVYPGASAALGGVTAPQRLDLLALAPIFASELIIGASIGLMAGIPMIAVQLAGVVVGQQIGLGIAQVVNPATDIEGNDLGQLLYVLALAAFLALGGVEVMFGSVIFTFQNVPIGGFALSEPPLELLLSMLTAGFDLAARIAMPVLAIIFVENVGMGFIMKTVPSLNIMTFGFPIRIMVGLSVLVAALPMTSEVVWVGVESALHEIEGWALALRA
jgi:flagellar biosynthetic protein FliR